MIIKHYDKTFGTRVIISPMYPPSLAPRGATTSIIYFTALHGQTEVRRGHIRSLRQARVRGKQGEVNYRKKIFIQNVTAIY